MEINHSELKHLARERVLLTQPRFWVVALSYLAMTIGVSWLISFIPLPSSGNTLDLFLQLLLTLYTTVVRFGLCLWALWTYRQLDPGVNSLIQGFSVAGRVLLLELGVFLRTMGWCFLAGFILVIPSTILFTMASSEAAYLVAGVLYTAIILAAIVVITLRYALAPYLLADHPDGGASAPIYRSVELMRGWKWELFKLDFSFIGYEIINYLLSFGVIVFFLSQAGLLSFSFADANQALEWAQACRAVIYSTPVVILSTLATVPVSLWLIPYRSVAWAGFYDARLQAASQENRQMPQMPPL